MLAAVLPLRGSSKLVTRWIIATAVVSLIAMVDKGRLTRWLALEPALVWRGQLWRLVTWVLIAPRAVGLVAGCVAIGRFGSDLAAELGDRRLLRYVLEVIATASVLTVLAGRLVESVWHSSHVGLWAVWIALLIGWARAFPDAVFELHDAFRIAGRGRIALVVGLTCTMAIIAGPLHLLPELVACAVACAYPTDRLRT